MNFLKRPAAVICVLAVTTAVQAEEAAMRPKVLAANEVTPMELGEVVVSAPITQQAAEGTGLEEKHLVPLRSSTSDTASLLRDVPGVSLSGAGGVSSLPAIHGLSDDRLRVQVDGMDLISSCPNHMNPALSYIDPTNVGSVKVFAGISPVSVGGDSIGGTIKVDSAAPEFAEAGKGTLLKGQAGGFYRSNGDARGGNLSATLAGETISMTYSGSMAQSDNYVAAKDFKTTTATGRPGHTLPLDEVGSSAYKTNNHNLGLALKSADHLIEAKLGYQDIPYELYPNQRMDMLGNTERRINLRDLVQFDWGSLDARVYHETVEHYMDFGDDKQLVYGAISGMPMYTESRNTGASMKATIDLSEQDFMRVGGEYQRYRLDDWWPPVGTSGGMQPDTFWNINNGKRDRAALFAEWESSIKPQWITLLGARYERVTMDTGPVDAYAAPPEPADQTNFNSSNREKTDNNWDLAALARYTPDATRTIEFGFAQKTRSPNLYERYVWRTRAMEMVMNNFVGDGNGYVGDPDLKPEVAHTFSATFDWHATDRKWEFKATPYYTQVTDYIDAERCTINNTFTGSNCPAANTATTQFVQLKYANQEARLLGIDLSGRMPLASTGMGEFGMKGLLNYTSGKNLDTGDELYNIMPLNAKLTLTQQKGGWDNSVELVMVDAKDDVSDVRNEINTPGYSLTNLRGSYNWKQARIDFGVENLFDKFYYLPTGGAYTGQGMTMSLTGIPWGIAVPGMGRSIYTGVTVKF